MVMVGPMGPRWATLTVVRPAGVEEVATIGGEGHIQDAPAHVPRLDAPELPEGSVAAVIQADRLV